MARFNEPCRLAALALLAVVTASMHGLSAQAQAPAPASAPAPVRPPESSAPAATPAAPAAVPAIPTDPEDLGDSLSGHQRYQAAIAAYAKITDPSAAVWNKMGIAYQMMFNLKDASRCYNASLKLDPRNATVLNNLATVNDSLKQFGIAERYYRKALKIDPRSALILRNLGSNQLAQHKYKKGWAMYQSALAIDPQIFQTHSGASVENPASTQERGAMHYYMAKGCVSAGNHECAIQNLRLAINEGYISPKKIATDSSFASLYELPAFQQMIAAQGTPQ
jgi:tetratricopeptide (TPR) repeat protein